MFAFPLTFWLRGTLGRICIISFIFDMTSLDQNWICALASSNSAGKSSRLLEHRASSRGIREDLKGSRNIRPESGSCGSAQFLKSKQWSVAFWLICSWYATNCLKKPRYLLPVWETGWGAGPVDLKSAIQKKKEEKNGPKSVPLPQVSFWEADEPH